MSLKLKVLGLGLLAVMATSAFAVSSSATTGGHFVSDSHFLTLTGTETYNPKDPSSTPHNLSFFRVDASGQTVAGSPIKCTHVAYHGETLEGSAATTTTKVRVRPDYTGSNNCSTGAVAEPHDVTVHVPTSCETNVFEFTSGNTGTVSVNCDITITHPNCTIKIPNIAENKHLHGITYDTDTDAISKKHIITVTADVTKIRGYFEGGLCVFLGTSHTFEMVGSATVSGENAIGEPVNITHTDP